MTDDSRASSQSGREISSRQAEEMEIEVDGWRSSQPSSSSWRRCDQTGDCSKVPVLGVLAQAARQSTQGWNPAAVEVPVAQGAAAREGGPYFEVGYSAVGCVGCGLLVFGGLIQRQQSPTAAADAANVKRHDVELGRNEAGIIEAATRGASDQAD